MELINRKMMAQLCAERFKNQYFKDEKWMDGVTAFGGVAPEQVWKALEELHKEANGYPDPDAIDGMLGNKEWTWPACDECRRYVPKAVIIGNRFRNATVCFSCLKPLLYKLFK